MIAYILIALAVIVSIIGYLYINRARDYKITLSNFKESDLYELTFKNTDDEVIMRENDKQAGMSRRNPQNLVKAQTLNFDIGHVKLKEIIIIGKLVNADIILYRDNEKVFEVNNLTKDASVQPLIYTY